MKRHAAAVAAVLAVGPAAVAGCGTGEPQSGAAVLAATPITVADTGSPVGTTLAAIYRAAFARAGVDAVVVPTRGLPDGLAALDDTRVSVLPTFSGDALALLDRSSDARSSEDVHEALARSLPDWLTVADSATAADDVVVRTSSTVTGAATLSAFAPSCADATVRVIGESDVAGSDATLATLADVYGCRFRARVGENAGVLVGRALTAPLPETAADATTLADDRTAFPAQEVVPIVRKGALDESAGSALETVAGELTTADLAASVERVAAGESADAVAQRWVDEAGGR
ncbi:glycine betaine ABC transporter substrate-binding protein [Rhodococcoides corynebacterioides]|uniref:glycine betaine ABC transporter substrate-binding protein n=1 Tax=Rhodococcoides corynebacterioides TaxID=53972 RepID=UPI000830EA5D|nr:glycine betaine ABC transporter substrate-binding protein [Rhodococcus corynebacterioides]